METKAEDKSGAGRWVPGSASEHWTKAGAHIWAKPGGLMEHLMNQPHTSEPDESGDDPDGTGPFGELEEGSGNRASDEVRLMLDGLAAAKAWDEARQQGRANAEELRVEFYEALNRFRQAIGAAPYSPDTDAKVDWHGRAEE